MKLKHRIVLLDDITETYTFEWKGLSGEGSIYFRAPYPNSHYVSSNPDAYQPTGSAIEDHIALNKKGE